MKPWTKFVKFDTLPDGGECFENSRYVVIRRSNGDGGLGPLVHLSIHSQTRDAEHDWRDFQRIKNELVGPEAEGLELYPAESRMVDTSNQFHLWVFPEFKFPFGYNERLVTESSVLDETKQRPFEEKPEGLLTREETAAKVEFLFGQNANGATIPQIACPVAPTVWQPQEWPLICLRCTKRNVFVEESDEKINPACELLHPDDELRCGSCDVGFSGRDYEVKDPALTMP